MKLDLDPRKETKWVSSNGVPEQSGECSRGSVHPREGSRPCNEWMRGQVPHRTVGKACLLGSLRLH